MASYIYDMVDTWNNAATTFTSIKMNVTDTASNAASLLMDLQVGGTSRFSVSKAGRGTFAAGGLFTTTLEVGGGTFAITSTYNSVLWGSGAYGWVAGNATSTSVPDTFLTRRAAANLRLGAADAAAPVAQTLSVQSVVAGTTNTAGANLTITGSQGTGTGAGGSIIFQVAPAGSSGTAQNALATALTIDSTKAATFAGTVSVGGSAGVSTLSSSLNIFSIVGLTSVNIGPLLYIGAAGNYDVALNRDAANTLALRNGASAQTFRSYRSFTDASNYSRLAMAWNTSTALVMAEGAGTGSDGSVAFNDAALATNATVGFVMIPSCAGAPTGTPADIPTGQIPMVWDSTNLKLYVYTGGAWKSSAAFT